MPVTLPPGPRWDDDPVPLDVTVGGTADAPEVRVSGELDLHGSASLIACARELVRPGASLRIDLVGVTFIDSTGANALVRIDRDARERGATGVRMVAARGGAVAGLLALTGLDALLDLELAPG